MGLEESYKWNAADINRKCGCREHDLKCTKCTNCHGLDNCSNSKVLLPTTNNVNDYEDPEEESDLEYPDDTEESLFKLWMYNTNEFENHIVIIKIGNIQ